MINDGIQDKQLGTGQLAQQILNLRRLVVRAVGAHSRIDGRAKVVEVVVEDRWMQLKQPQFNCGLPQVDSNSAVDCPPSILTGCSHDRRVEAHHLGVDLVGGQARVIDHLAQPVCLGQGHFVNPGLAFLCGTGPRQICGLEWGRIHAYRHRERLCSVPATHRAWPSRPLG